MAVISQFKLLPKAGGFDDQDWEWTQDLKQYMQGLAWARAQKTDKSKAPEDLGAGDWTEY